MNWKFWKHQKINDHIPKVEHQAPHVQFGKDTILPNAPEIYYFNCPPADYDEWAKLFPECENDNGSDRWIKCVATVAIFRE